jgi:hypothetical protein
LSVNIAFIGTGFDGFETLALGIGRLTGRLDRKNCQEHKK